MLRSTHGLGSHNLRPLEKYYRGSIIRADSCNFRLARGSENSGKRACEERHRRKADCTGVFNTFSAYGVILTFQYFSVGVSRNYNIAYVTCGVSF